MQKKDIYSTIKTEQSLSKLYNFSRNEKTHYMKELSLISIFYILSEILIFFLINNLVIMFILGC